MIENTYPPLEDADIDPYRVILSSVPDHRFPYLVLDAHTQETIFGGTNQECWDWIRKQERQAVRQARENLFAK